MNENETQDVVTEDVVEEIPEETTDNTKTTDTVTEEPKVEKPKESLEQRQARLSRELKQVNKKLGVNEEEPKAKTGRLDDTALDYLDLKGVSEAEDIKVIQNIVDKTGLTVREALKDEYVVAKLAANKASREVKDATPSATKRSGGNSPDEVSRAVAKFEKDGTMPDNFELRNKVVDALVSKTETNAPSWHR